MVRENTRVLLMTSEFPPLPGGIGNHAHNLAKYLGNEGFDVVVLADQRSNNLNKDLEFDEVQNYNVVRVKITSPRVFMYFTRLKQLFFLVSNTDVVIASGKFPLWAVAYISLFRKNKFIAITHGTEVNFKAILPKTLVNLSLKRFDEVIAVSNFTKSLIKTLNLKSIRVIPNGFDITSWKESVVAGNLKGTPKLLTIGHVSERKGQGNVISLLPDLVKKFPNIHYHSIGLPTEAERFKTKASQLGVLSHVTFHGYLDFETMQSMILDADICVLMSDETSSGDVEGFGIALLEANAMGIPVIAALGSGVEDAVDNGNSGYLVPHRDVEAFANAIDSILENKEQFKIQAKTWAENFKWELVIKKYIEVINKVV